MTTSKQNDNLNRLSSISSLPSYANSPSVSFAYAYNSANQRTNVTQFDGAADVRAVREPSR